MCIHNDKIITFLRQKSYFKVILTSYDKAKKKNRCVYGLPTDPVL